jgi:hypothetical protein
MGLRVEAKIALFAEQWRTSARESSRPDRTIKQLDKSPFHRWCIEKLNQQGGRDPSVHTNDPSVHTNVPMNRDRESKTKS